MKTLCNYCNQEFEISTGHYNRAIKQGNSVYCNRVHAELGRRIEKSVKQKKAEKREYDRQFREKNADRIKKEKARWFKNTYDPVKAAIKRKEIMPRHVEYCRQPQYKKWKKEYDKKYRAQKEYGEFSEAFIALTKLESELDTREFKYEWGLTNKSQNRKRSWQRKLTN